MPNRVIRDAMLDSEAVLTCTVEARWLFVVMILSADDLGLCEATEFKLARRADIKREHVPALLSQLADRDLVRLYDGPGMRKFAFIPRFGQRFRAKGLRNPPPPLALVDEETALLIKDLAPEMTDACQHDADTRARRRRRRRSRTSLSSVPSDKEVGPERAHSGPFAPTLGTEEPPEDGASEGIDKGRAGGQQSLEGIEAQQVIAKVKAKASKPPVCPHDEIIALYHEVLPTWVQTRIRTATRDKATASLWSSVVAAGDTKAQGLDLVREYFTRCTTSDFLMGRVSSRERGPFKGTLQFLCRPETVARVIEGFYHRKP